MPKLVKRKLKTFGRALLMFGLFLAIALVILWPQISSHAFISGTDSIFHMNRFYETAMQIKTGHFSYFQSLYGFSRSGRFVNSFYGPVMAYFSGWLLLICKNWITFQIVSDLLQISLSGCFMYLLCTRNQVKKVIAFAISIIYMTSYPIVVWATAQQFTGWGATFFPLVILCGTQWLNRGELQVLPLTLIIAFLMQIHLIGSVLAALTLLPLFVVALVHAKDRGLMMFNAVKAFFFTILLTGNVWGSIVGIFTTNHIIPIFPEKYIMNYAVKWSGFSIEFLNISLTIIFVLTIILILRNYTKFDYREWTYLFVCWFFLWMSSNCFPWKTIQKADPQFVNIIQMPKRFLVAAIVLGLLTFGMVLSKTWSWNFTTYSEFTGLIVKMVLLVVLAVTNVFQFQGIIHTESNTFHSNQVLNQPMNLLHILPTKRATLRRSFSSSNLGKPLKEVHKATPDYLPTNRKLNLNKNDNYSRLHPYAKCYAEYIWPARMFKRSVVGENTLVTTYTNHAKHNQETKVPLSVYHQSKITLNGKLIQHPRLQKAGGLLVKSRPGKNRITLQFVPDWSIRAILLIAILSWIGILIDLIRKMGRKLHEAQV